MIDNEQEGKIGRDETRFTDWDWDSRYIELLREHTPAVQTRIHLNNAGASLMPTPVTDALISYIEQESRNGGYETFDEMELELEQFYESAAALINCRKNEIAFTDSATRAWDLAFYSIPFEKGDRILVSMAEYASNFIAYLQMKERKEVELVIVPNDDQGQIDTDALANLIDNRTRLISLTHVPTNGGLVNDAEKVGKIAREAEVIYLLDACQSAGQLSLDIEKLSCDLLSVTGRKYLRGPRATGFLYASEKILDELVPIFLDVHGATWIDEYNYRVRNDTKRFETWEQNFAGKFALKKAIEYAMEIGIPRIERRVVHLAKTFREKLSELELLVVADAGRNKCGIVSFFIHGHESRIVAKDLADAGISVSYSTARGTRLDMESRQLPDLVRASVHYFNTEFELDKTVETIASLYGLRRRL